MKSNVWSTGVIMPIYKKGDKNKSEDYSKISLTSTLSEMFTYLLTQRLGSVVKITIFYLKHSLPIYQDMEQPMQFFSGNAARYAQQRHALSQTFVNLLTT